jgi:transposase
VHEQRQAWPDEVAPIDLDHFVFLDETGVNTAMTRRYARSKRGQRVVERVPEGRWQTLTLLSAIRTEGIAGSLAFPGGTDTEAFTTYLDKVLLPSLRPGDVVILDRLNVHKAARVKALVESVGAKLQLLPPYSPDFNPIEKMWSKVKEQLRKAKARTTEALHQAITAALQTVTQLDIRNWFASCGYGTPESKPL